jgi:hypothetical protein
MMNRTRQIIAVTLVATALCADRALAAGPVVNQRVATVACRVAARFATQFRRTVPSFKRIEQRSPGGISRDVGRAAPAVDPVVEPFAFSPFQFRLPPPVA